MAATQRYRRGRVKQVSAKLGAGGAAVGDLVGLQGGVMAPFSALALSASAFSDVFAGVFVEGVAGRGCLVSASGVFEYPLSVSPAPAAVAEGTPVAAAGDQLVSTGATVADAIGRLAKAVAVGDSTAWVEIESALYGGAQAMA